MWLGYLMKGSTITWIRGKVVLTQSYLCPSMQHSRVLMKSRTCYMHMKLFLSEQVSYAAVKPGDLL